MKDLVEKKNKGGRPRMYKTPQELEAKIAEYFSGGAYKRKVVTQLGVEVEIPTPTISDLVLFLGFADRQSFYEYGDHPEFTYAIKKARTLIEREYENLLRSSSCTGAIFALKNFGWIDRTEHEHSGEFSIQGFMNDFKAAKGRAAKQNNRVGQFSP